MLADEPYTMPSYAKLLVADPARTAGFYELLGFQCVQRDNVFVHLRWARYADLFLVATPPGLTLPGARGVGVILCFHAGGDVALETIAARASAAGAAVDGPREQPWYTREVLITDPEGYRVAFVEPSDALRI
jgi:lactoylglutathione lyase